MNEITLHKFPENREKTIYRRLDSLKKVIPEMVEEFNGNKTADDRRKTLENIANIIGIIQSVIFVFNTVIQKERTRLDSVSGGRGKVKFFDIAKDFKADIKDFKKELDIVVKDFQRADREGINREKSICYEKLESLSRELQNFSAEYAAEISIERGEWLNAVSTFHDGNREDLKHRYT